MGIEKQEVYTVKCDNCGEYSKSNNGTTSAFLDELTAGSVVVEYEDWTEKDGKYYCTDCCDFDGNLIINPVVAKSDEFVCIQQTNKSNE